MPELRLVTTPAVPARLPMLPVPAERSSTAVSLRLSVAPIGLLLFAPNWTVPAFTEKVPSMALPPVSLRTPLPDLVRLVAATPPAIVATPLE